MFRSSRSTTHRLDQHGVKPWSLRTDLHNFSLFAQYARKQRWIIGDPMENVSIPSDDGSERDNVLTEEMETKFFARAFDIVDRDGRRNLYDLGRLMILQGCRPEELMVLRQEHVDLAKREMRIVAGKSRAAKRTLSLCQESIELLRPRLDCKSPWVFPSDRKPGRPIGKLQGPQDKVCRESEVSCVIYDLRHTFATRMIESGADVMTVARILGHSNLRTIQRYVHLSDSHVKEAMDRFEAAQTRKKLRVVAGRR
jgi:integrase